MDSWLMESCFMKFTIITPSLNYGCFLGDCLESVAQQFGQRRTGANDAMDRVQESCKHSEPIEIEHLVMDGGSTDDSAMQAARFPHITWIQEPDRGMSDAINKGLARARGDWVMWLNADDRLKPGALSAMLDVLRTSTADVVYGNWDFVDESGNFLRRIVVPGWSRFVHVHHHCLIGSTAAFYRRSTVVEEGHRLREDFRYVMDGEFYARLDRAGKRFEHVNVRVADFRIHGANASQRHLGKSRNMESILAAEWQHVESRAIRRAYGITCFEDPYLNGLVDGVLWIMAKLWKGVLKIAAKR